MIIHCFAEYFHAAISIGDSIFSPWAVEDNQLEQARQLGYRFTCDSRTDRLVECLRYIDLASLLTTTGERDWNNNREPFWFRPVVDRNVSGSALLTDFPLKLYNAGNVHRVPYLLIASGQEGSLEYYLQSERIKSFSTVNSKIGFLIRPYLKTYTNEDVLAAAFKSKYFNRTGRAVYRTSGTNTGNGNLLSGGGGPGSLGYQNQFNQGQYGGAIGAAGSGLYNTLGVDGYTDQEVNQIFVNVSFLGRELPMQTDSLCSQPDAWRFPSFGPG